MPAAKRVRTAATQDWETLQLRLRWPEQYDYEVIRPVVLFGLPVADRADETGVSQRTIARHADRFDAAGFAGLRELEPAARLPDDIRQALRELKAEYAGFGLRELATIIDVRFGRRVGHHTVARVLADGSLAPAQSRRFPPYRQLTSGTERRLAVVRLHAAEDFADLPDKPHTRHRRALKVDLTTMDIARELQENPLLGAFRLRSKLKQSFGIELSERTCGRILAHNRAVYGLPGPEKQPHTPRPRPFAARYRHQYWIVDLRYIDHQLDADNVYCFVYDYSEQDHWAHRQRRDGQRSPKDVLNWLIGTPHASENLAQLFAPVRYARRFDQEGYAQFRRWRVYGHRALPKQPALVWLSEETLTVQYAEEPLAYYTAKVNQRGELTAVTEPQRLPSPYQSPQPWLWALSPEERLLALPVPKRGRRCQRHRAGGVQGWFSELAAPRAEGCGGQRP